MASRAKADSEGSARRGSNFDPQIVESFVKRVELLKDEKKLLKDDFKKETLDPIDADVTAVIEEADGAGIPPNILKAAILKRKLERDARAVRDKFDGGTRDDYDALLLALGELHSAAAE